MKSQRIEEEDQVEEPSLPRIFENRLIGLDSQERKLDSLVLDFKKTRKGNSCVLSGRRGSGKTTLLNSVLERHFPGDAKSDILTLLDGDEHTTAKLLTDQGLLNVVSEDRMNAASMRIFIIDHFEAFSTKQYQCFLYSILNGSQINPWLVILVGTTEDSVNLLEKRIKSRLSRIRINFDMRVSHEEIVKCFYNLLQLYLGESEVEKVRMFSSKMETSLKLFVAHHCSYSLVKKLVLVLGTFIHTGTTAHLDLPQIFQLCIESIWPANEMLSILESVSLRQLCLLRCLVLVQKGLRRMEFSCRDVITEYNKFVNEYDSSMQTPPAVLYKDVDELISLSAIKLKSGTDVGQLDFRKIFLNIEEETIMMCFNKRAPPQKIKHWIEN